MLCYSCDKIGGCSRGTKHMIDLAKKHGLEVHVINY